MHTGIKRRGNDAAWHSSSEIGELIGSPADAALARYFFHSLRNKACVRLVFRGEITVIGEFPRMWRAPLLATPRWRRTVSIDAKAVRRIIVCFPLVF
jgi:hypothetical protein